MSAHKCPATLYWYEHLLWCYYFTDENITELKFVRKMSFSIMKIMIIPIHCYFFIEPCGLWLFSFPKKLRGIQPVKQVRCPKMHSPKLLCFLTESHSIPIQPSKYLYVRNPLWVCLRVSEIQWHLEIWLQCNLVDETQSQEFLNPQCLSDFAANILPIIRQAI